MPLIDLKCPGCGAPIQMDSTKDFGFCMYCGNKMIIRDEITNIHIHDESNHIHFHYEMPGKYQPFSEYEPKLEISNLINRTNEIYNKATDLVKDKHIGISKKESNLKKLFQEFREYEKKILAINSDSFEVRTLQRKFVILELIVHCESISGWPIEPTYKGSVIERIDRIEECPICDSKSLSKVGPLLVIQSRFGDCPVQNNCQRIKCLNCGFMFWEPHYR